MSVRMRVVGWEVRPVVMADEGDTLSPVPIPPQMILSAQWQAFKDGGDVAALSTLREQIEGPTEAEPELD